MTESTSSHDWWRRAKRTLPGGVSRDQLFLRPPFVVERGAGSTIYDVEGEAYIDYVNNYTSLIHGHAFGPINVAVQAQLAKGTAFGVPNTLEVVLAEKIADRSGAPVVVRFTNSGSEATMLAIQVARRVTGRSWIAKFEGGYHGSFDDLRISVKPEPAPGPAGRPDAVLEAGVPSPIRTCVLPYNDVAGMTALADASGSDWACVIVEPMQGSAGMLPAEERFLVELRRQADRHGFLLVFDEVMTYRLGLNGVQGLLGIQPDLTALAKIIGGGLPVGALAGRVDLMDVLAPPERDRIHHAGTFNGNPLTMAAGCAALDHYEQAQVDALNKSGDELRDSLNASLNAVGFSASGIGSLLNVHGSPTPPRTWRDVLRSDRAAVANIQQRLRNRGLFIAPRGMMALSTAHSQDELALVEREIVDACRSVA